MLFDPVALVFRFSGNRLSRRLSARRAFKDHRDTLKQVAPKLRRRALKSCCSSLCASRALSGTLFRIVTCGSRADCLTNDNSSLAEIGKLLRNRSSSRDCTSFRRLKPLARNKPIQDQDGERQKQAGTAENSDRNQRVDIGNQGC